MAAKLSALLFLLALAACASAQTMITTCQELQDMNLDLAGNYALANDIDCSATSGWNSGAGFEPVGNFTAQFTGSLDGQNYQITDLAIDRSSTDYVGLFGFASSTAAISSLGLVGGSISGKSGVGGLVGWNAGSITNTHATGNVTGTSSYVGGLAGSNSGSATVSHAYARGSVTGSSDYVAGLIGWNTGTVANAYATGSVTGSNDYVAGLVGNNIGSLANVYATTHVTGGGSNVGGLIGRDFGLGVTTNGYWDTQASGQGTSAGGGGVVGKTTVQMHQEATFQGWDFDCVWTINEGVSYPQLTFAECSGRTVTVTTCSGLQDAVALTGATITLGQDIDCSDTLNWNGGAGFSPGTALTLAGEFIGQDYKILGLVINRPTTSGVALFASLGALAQIDAVGLEGGSISGDNYVSSLVGRNYGAVTNAYATGSVTGSNDYVGGLVARNYGSLTDAYATGSVTGSSRVGGLVGQSFWDTILTNVYATGSVTGSSAFVGGLVGNNLGTVVNAYATGSVTGSNANVGGLLGWNSGIVTNVYATGSVIGGEEVGGLVGTTLGNITNAYATGNVIGTLDYDYAPDTIGGLIGRNYSDLVFIVIISTYWDTETSAQSLSAGGTGRTTAEMYQQATYVGWNFTDIWQINEGLSYPELRAFVSSDPAVTPSESPVGGDDDDDDDGNPSGSNGGGSLSGAAIAGISIGILAAAGTVAGGIIFMKRRRNAAQSDSKSMSMI